MVVATFSLLTVIALAAAMIMTPYSVWVRLDINRKKMNQFLGGNSVHKYRTGWSTTY